LPNLRQNKPIWPGRPRRRSRSLSRQGIIAVLPPKSGAMLYDLGSLELEEKRAEREEKRAEREDRRALLELEERKAAQEAEMRKVALESEAEARRLEAEERRAEREARAMEADRNAKMKLEQAKLAHEIRVLELKAQQTQLGEDAGDDYPRPSLEGRVIWRFIRSDLEK